MWITQVEGNEMYARFLVARNGKLRARKIAKQKAEALKQAGDHSGHDVWQDVAQLIDRPNGKRPSA